MRCAVGTAWRSLFSLRPPSAAQPFGAHALRSVALGVHERRLPFHEFGLPRTPPRCAFAVLGGFGGFGGFKRPARRVSCSCAGLTASGCGPPRAGPLLGALGSLRLCALSSRSARRSRLSIRPGRRAAEGEHRPRQVLSSRPGRRAAESEHRPSRASRHSVRIGFAPVSAVRFFRGVLKRNRAKLVRLGPDALRRFGSLCGSRSARRIDRR